MVDKVTVVFKCLEISILHQPSSPGDIIAQKKETNVSYKFSCKRHHTSCCTAVNLAGSIVAQKQTPKKITWSEKLRALHFNDGSEDQFPEVSCPWRQGSLGPHGAHLGPAGPRWAPCWPHEPCYRGMICHEMGLLIPAKAKPSGKFVNSIL